MALHRDWGEAQGNYDELRFFTGLRPSEEIALVVRDYNRQRGVLSVSKARLLLGRNPLLVAKEHGHRIITMLTVYAAWVDGATEADIAAIRAARTQRRSSARKSAAAQCRSYMTTPEPLCTSVPVPPPEVPALTDRVRWSAQAWRRRLANGGAAVGAPEGTDLRDEEEFGSGSASSNRYGPLTS